MKPDSLSDMYVNLDDTQLMALVVIGDHDAFTELVKRHTAKYFALAFRTVHNKAEAEDIVQTAFIKLWQKPTAWQKQKSQFTTWFYRVVINACYDFQRKHSRVTGVDQHVLEAFSEPIAGEQESLERDQQQRWQKYCLELAIQKLPRSQRDAINLVVYGEMPQKKAAEVLGTTVKALESLLVRAKRSISKTVTELESGEMPSNALLSSCLLYTSPSPRD